MSLQALTFTDILNEVSEATGIPFNKYVDQGQQYVDLAKRIVDDPVGTSFRKSYVLTTLTPPIKFDSNQLKTMISQKAGKAPPPPPGTKTFKQKVEETYLERLKPNFAIESPLFGNYTYAPYGTITPETWKETWTKIALVTVAGLAAYGIVTYSIGYRRGSRSTG